jgi:hypothetical protein
MTSTLCRKVTCLATTAHGDAQFAVSIVDDGDAAAVSGDASVDFTVEQLLDGRANLGVGASPGCLGGRILEDGGRAGQEQRADLGTDGGFQLRPFDFSNLAHGDDVIGDEHMGNAGQAEELLRQGRTGGALGAVEEEGSARMNGSADREFARVGVGQQHFGANRNQGYGAGFRHLPHSRWFRGRPRRAGFRRSRSPCCARRST